MSSFKPGKSDTGESVFSKIEKIETEFENLKVGENIQYFLATFFMKEISDNDVINEIEKRCIQDKVEKVADKQIMSEVKEAFKRMKVEGKRDKAENSNENKTFYANSGFERSRYGAWKKSRDFKDFSRTGSNNWRTKSGNRWRKSESKFRSGSRSQSRRPESEGRGDRDIKQTLEKLLKRLNSLDEKHEKMAKILDEKVVNSQYVEEDWSNEGMNIYYTKDVKGAKEMVVDCGAPKTLIGEKYMVEYLKVQLDT